jgi:SOS-response transcriptional repressor LexA
MFNGNYFTPKEKELFMFIKNFIEKNHYAPSYKEMKKFKKTKSDSGINHLLDKLEAKNYILRDKWSNRSVRINYESFEY